MAGVTSRPDTTISLLPAANILSIADRNDLIVGQLAATASATSGALNTNIQSMGGVELRALVGDDHLYNTIINWQAGNDGYTPLSVIGLDPNGSGDAATSTIVFTGTSTAAGTYTIACADERDFEVSISVASGDTAAEVATAVAAAFTALGNFPPFATTSATSTVTFTASDVGTIGNNYSVKVDGVIAGLTYAIVGFTGGATDPVLTSVLDPIDGERYTSILWPENWSASTAIATDILDARFNAANDILDGVAFTGHSDTFANNQSFVASLNSQSLVVAGNNKVSEDAIKGSSIVQSADYTMAYFMGVESKRLTTGSPLASDIVATNAPLDATGGPHLASLPLFNTPLSLTPVTPPTYLFSNIEQNTLTAAGFSTFGVNRALNGMIMGEVVTTRTTDAAGNENNSFSYLNYVRTGSVCREIFFNNLKAEFNQSRLTTGQTRPGYKTANQETILATLAGIYRVLANQSLVRAGTDAEAFFANNTTIDITEATGTVSITSLLPIVVQLRTINYPLTLSFDS